ncbi:DNase I-like protein [Saccharata proteae CBS 121410]|uniref:DNase I-like protein n=1 Tax=Saccharata proteae CBS 121410 TaxID=1314787 RepID=A0A9P4HUI2_9PEZI|nr:DNase I-like protein [Saccharata proteae CBS 121410]
MAIAATASAAPELQIYTLTFNAARAPVDPLLLGRHFFDALPAHHAALPDVIVVCLQELSPIAYSFLGRACLDPYFDRVAQSVHVAAARHERASSVQYETLVARNLGMTAIMVFVKPETAPAIRRVHTAGAGVGLWDMGNKGAVGVRMAFAPRDSSTPDEEVCTTFVAAHLAPMEDACERRNQDWHNLLRNLVFEPVAVSGGTGRSTSEPLLSTTSSSYPLEGLYMPTTHILFAGDLNYRTHNKKPTPADHHSFPQPTPDTTSSLHYTQHLTRDQLTRELKAGRVLQGFSELPITFPPTYKYSFRRDSPTDEKWVWAKHRWPSWCDRILFVPAAAGELTPHKYTSLPLMPTSDHQPVALSATLALTPVRAADDDIRRHPPCPINPDWRARRSSARIKEVVVGVLAYAVLMREGQVMLFAVLAATVGFGLVLRSFW